MAAIRGVCMQGGIRAVSLVAMMCAAGCMMFYDPVPYLSMARQSANDAPALTEWTLRQTDVFYVARGVMALKLIAECEVEAPPQQGALAVLGLVKIADKRRGGWPAGDHSDYWAAGAVLEAARAGLSSCESTRIAFEQQLDNAESGANAAEWQRANDALQRGFPPLEH